MLPLKDDTEFFNNVLGFMLLKDNPNPLLLLLELFVSCLDSTIKSPLVGSCGSLRSLPSRRTGLLDKYSVLCTSSYQEATNVKY